MLSDRDQDRDHDHEQECSVLAFEEVVTGMRVASRDIRRR